MGSTTASATTVSEGGVVMEPILKEKSKTRTQTGRISLVCRATGTVCRAGAGAVAVASPH